MMDHLPEERLHEYVDGAVPAAAARDVERHLATCTVCREEVARLRSVLTAARSLPRSIEPPRDFWAGIEARIQPYRRTAVPPFRRLAPWLLAAAVLAALLLARQVFAPPGGGAWDVVRVAGSPTIGATPLGETGSLRVGEWLETNDSSRALVAVGDIGQVDVKPGTRIRLVAARPTEHRLALERGAIYATVDAPPRLFFVETPSGVAVDLGCAYTLAVDSAGNSVLHVTAGWVEFQWRERRSLVPLGAAAETRPGVGPGVPYVEDAPAALRRALVAFDFESGGATAVRAALASARAEDALSLWHLLARVDAPLRGAVYDRLAAFVSPPEGVTRDGVLRLDARMLERYWSTIRRIAWRREILRGIRQIDPRTGLAK